MSTLVIDTIQGKTNAGSINVRGEGSNNTNLQQGLIKAWTNFSGITTTAEVMEFSRDIGRKWGDLHEIFVWEDGVKLDGDSLYYFQAIHQESDVIPENVDAIRALMGIEADWKTSVEKTDSAIAAYNGL